MPEPVYRVVEKKNYLPTWAEHKERWGSCTDCDLCQSRSKIVLARGSLPCDVLFLGEAPGTSEDTLGRPFVGQAGKLLDSLIESARPRSLRLAFTNLVACMPAGEKYGTTRVPIEDEILQCRGRLKDFINVARPQVIVLTGKLSEKYGRVGPSSVVYTTLLHPAAVIQADESQKGLALQKMLVVIKDAFETAETMLGID